MKPRFDVDIAPGAPGGLVALPLLRAVPPERWHHSKKGLRPPLGIYNISVSRIASRATALCERFEAYIRAGATIAALEPAERLRNELLDYMEFTLFAAAEHVDDIDSIATGLFPDRQYERLASFKTLQKEIKRLKRFVALTANVIKHQQARLRLNTIEMTQSGWTGCLHGFFVEAVEDYIVVPNTVLDAGQECFSVPTLVWEVLTFVLGASLALRAFLRDALDLPLVPPAEPDPLTRAIVAGVRLPLYTFGETPPFSRIGLGLRASDGNLDPVRSGLYGSALTPWNHDATPVFGSATGAWEGDGITVSFRLPKMTSVGLSRWD